MAVRVVLNASKLRRLSCPAATKFQTLAASLESKRYLAGATNLQRYSGKAALRTSAHTTSIHMQTELIEGDPAPSIDYPASSNTPFSAIEAPKGLEKWIVSPGENIDEEAARKCKKEICDLIADANRNKHSQRSYF